MAEDKYRRVLQAGEVLFQEGDAGDSAFVIESGQLEVSRGQGAEREVLALLGPGEMLGEMSLLDHLPRSASAAARQPTRLRAITGEHLKDKLDGADPLLRLLLKMILKRYRIATDTEGDAADQASGDKESVLKRLRLEQELQQALERREFVLYFQPIVDLNTYSVAGFEALIRWISPTRGFVSPGEFMPAVEGSQLIYGVGRWVLEEGCAAIKRLNALPRPAGTKPLFMCLNLSGKQLESDALMDDLRGAIQAADIDPHVLKLEITESLLMTNLEHAVGVLQKCRDLGCMIAIDDFGTGYSSLSYLNKFPIDTLKVDRSFVTPMLTDEGSRKILSAVGGLAHSLGMNIVAEGVEELSHAEALAALHFEYAQGYVFAKPASEQQAGALLGADWPWKFERRHPPGPRPARA